MQAELLKGDQSEVPQDTLAAISTFKDFLNDSDPTREGYGEAINQGLDSIKARKLDLYQKLKSGDELTSSQTVGLGILALGLLAAGGAAKGKKGIGMAGNAFNQGGQLYLAQNDAQNKADHVAELAQLKDLGEQERDLTKQGVENKLAPIKENETIGAKLKYRRQAIAEGLLNPNGQTVNVVLPKHVDTQTAKQIDQAGSTINQLTSLADDLDQVKPGVLGDRMSWQAKSRLSSTDEGKLNSRIMRAALQAARMDSGGRPSQFLEQIELKLNTGDITSSPRDVATLLRQRAGELAASTATVMRDAEANRTDYPGQIKRYESLAQSVGAKLGDSNKFLNFKQANTGQDGVERKAFVVDGQVQMLSRLELEKLHRLGVPLSARPSGGGSSGAPQEEPSEDDSGDEE